MTIGERIKELRKKNDLTQEKLADYLGVSYQAVSKWENGITCPDLSLIPPLTKLLHVTSDELLGLNEEITDERRAYFDAEYVEYWKKKDEEANYQTALQAVAEYPGDFKYLSWLASMEYVTADNEHYMTGDPEDHHERLESSIKHRLMILEDCKEEDLRRMALQGLVLIYSILDQVDEARKYADMCPEENSITRDYLYSIFLRGEEKSAHRQKMVFKAFDAFCDSMLDYWQYCDYLTPEQQKMCMDVQEAVIRTVIPDGNYIRFHWYLYHINSNRAEIAMKEGLCDDAVRALAEQKKNAMEYDRIRSVGKNRYTCPLLAGFEEDCSVVRPLSFVQFWREETEDELFDPLREREDFKALFDE